MIGGPPFWVARFQAIPYVERGYDFSGCHCYGLVHLVWRARLGIELARYAHIRGSDALKVSRALREANLGPGWRRVDGARQDMDVVLMASFTKRMRRYRGHVGIVAGPGRFVLHVERDTETSVCVPIDDQTITHRILATYRYAA